MEREFLQLNFWDQFGKAEAQDAAKALARCLPKPWKLKKVEWQELGDQKRYVAFYEWKGVDFALIPSGKITLGYDRKQPAPFTPEQLESWRETEEAYDWSLKKLLNHQMTRLRSVSLEPILLEVKPLEWEDMQESLGFQPEEDDDEDRIVAIRKVFGDAAFRFLTSDEWEHACAAGSRSVFRWGDGCPMDCYPCQTPAKGRRASTFNLHHLPNAFGLHMPPTGYETELCWEPKSKTPLLRGGDGGCATCGGCGFLAGWLPLASAFYEPETKDFIEEIDQQFLRRVYPLPKSALE